MDLPLYSGLWARIGTGVALREAKPLLKVEEVGAEAARLSAALEVLDAWLWDAATLFLKPGSERALLATLTDAEPDAAWPPTDDENKECCACCTPDEAHAAGVAGGEDVWVGCDDCDAWYHAPCVRVPEAQVAALTHLEPNPDPEPNANIDPNLSR